MRFPRNQTALRLKTFVDVTHILFGTPYSRYVSRCLLLHCLVVARVYWRENEATLVEFLVLLLRLRAILELIIILRSRIQNGWTFNFSILWLTYIHLNIWVLRVQKLNGTLHGIWIEAGNIMIELFLLGHLSLKTLVSEGVIRFLVRFLHVRRITQNVVLFLVTADRHSVFILIEILLGVSLVWLVVNLLHLLLTV